MQAPQTKDYLQLHGVVLIWGFTSVLGVLVTLPSVELVFYRALLSFAGLGLYIRYKGIRLTLGWQTAVQIGGTGMLIAAHWLLFFLAARVGNISSCLAGVATTALWTSILEPIITGKRFKGIDFLAGFLALAGLYFVFYYQIDKAAGVLLGIAAAVLSSLFGIFNSLFSRQRIEPMVITFVEMIGATIGLLLFFPVYTAYFAENGVLRLVPTLTDWGYILLLTSVCTVYAYVTAVDLLKKFTPFAINLTVNLEPVYGILLAVVCFGEKEKMTAGFYIGTAIILASVLLYPILNKRFYEVKPFSEVNF